MKVVGRCRLKLVGHDWGPEFVWIRGPRGVERREPSMLVPVVAWRTDHRFECVRCHVVWIQAPGGLGALQRCPQCQSVYWTGLSFAVPQARDHDSE